MEITAGLEQGRAAANLPESMRYGWQHPAIEMRMTEHGRGVFATERITKDTVIEVCPVVPIMGWEYGKNGIWAIYSYWFSWPDPNLPDPDGAIVYGYGALYNHDAAPNLSHANDYDHQSMVFITLRDVEPGEELRHDYGWTGGHERFASQPMLPPPDSPRMKFVNARREAREAEAAKKTAGE